MRHRSLWQAISTVVLLIGITTLGLAYIFSQMQSPKHTDTGKRSATPQVQRQISAAAHQGLSVKGTQLVDDQGRIVRLVGATRSSLEYACEGDGHFQQSDFAAMRSWGMNAVRITLSSELWANHDGACPTYRQTILDAVTHAEAQGFSVILDLQWNAPFDLPIDRAHGGAQCSMPDAQQDVAFWRDMATIFRADQRVLFDLFGEPHDVSWKTWYNGGTIVDGCDIISQGSLTAEHGTYQAIGMRDLVAAVRRRARKYRGGQRTRLGIRSLAGRALCVEDGEHPLRYSSLRLR
jgi:Cellulase (glycosyl hydrolase family 5)